MQRSKAEWWDWPTFWPAFWAGFGRMIALFLGVVTVLGLIVGTESADFGSACVGMFVGVLCAVIYGYDAGDDAVREWRYRQATPVGRN